MTSAEIEEAVRLAREVFDRNREQRVFAVEILARCVLALMPVYEAAQKIRRGCDCEYDHRCGRCDDIITLIDALASTRTSKEQG